MRTSFAGKILLLCAVLFVFTGCQGVYYNLMENVAGKHKREIMVDRVQEARESQEEAKEQFKTALEQFKEVTSFSGGSLEEQYNKINSQYERSEKRAEEVTSRIDAIEDVSHALFREWEKELEQYSSSDLRRESERKLESTRERYEMLISKMRKAEASMEPVLSTLRDQTLYLKHNLNAAAIASLEDNVASLETDINDLIEEMEESINEANRFIEELEGAAG
jgi:hypothetical protein